MNSQGKTRPLELSPRQHAPYERAAKRHRANKAESHSVQGQTSKPIATTRNDNTLAEKPSPICHPDASFLGLPREIRDIVYEYALVRGDISVVAAGSQREIARSEGEKGDDALYSGFYGCFPIKWRRKWMKRRTVFKLGLCQNGFSALTYELGEDSDISSYSALFQTNRQIHREASEMFYKRNRFCFPVYTHPGMTTFLCSAFLEDRTSDALEFITSLHLHVRIGTFDKDPELSEQSREQRDVERKQLVGKTAHERLRHLKHLSLTIAGKRTKGNEQETRPCAIPDMEWLGFVLALPKIKSLDVCYHGDTIFEPIYNSVAAYDPVQLIAYLRSRLLEPSEPLDIRNIRVFRRYPAVQHLDGWLRVPAFRIIVESHDDDHGNSLLQPSQPPREPRPAGALEKLCQEAYKDRSSDKIKTIYLEGSCWDRMCSGCGFVPKNMVRESMRYIDSDVIDIGLLPNPQSMVLSDLRHHRIDDVGRQSGTATTLA